MGNVTVWEEVAALRRIGQRERDRWEVVPAWQWIRVNGSPVVHCSPVTIKRLKSQGALS